MLTEDNTRNLAKPTTEHRLELERLEAKPKLSKANRELRNFLRHAIHDTGTALPFRAFYKHATTAEYFDSGAAANGSFVGWTKKGLRMARELLVNDN